MLYACCCWQGLQNWKPVGFQNLQKLVGKLVKPTENCFATVKKVYLGAMSILSILLSLKSGCHHPPLRRLTSSSVNPKPETSNLGHVRTSNTDTCVLYIQLAAYISYHVPHRGLTRHAYVPTSLIRTPPYPSQLIHTRP
jgi:hypothetical protein